MSSHHKPADNVWRKYAQLKWPAISPLSDEYASRREAFFCGIHAAFGFINNTPESMLPSLMADITAEVNTCLRPDAQTKKIAENILRNGAGRG